MKVRKGFVSNSSSSSFVIAKDKLTPLQVLLIEKHSGGLDKLEYLALATSTDTELIDLDALPWEHTDKWGGRWDIEQTDTEVYGYTSMDNYDIFEFLSAIGVKDEHIQSNRRGSIFPRGGDDLRPAGLETTDEDYW